MPARIAAARSAATPSLTAQVKQWAEGFNFRSTSAVDRLGVARSKAATTGPTSLQRAYALYRQWEDNDLGSVRLLSTQLGGAPVYALHTTTDGDRGFLELHGERGLLASGTTGFDAQGRRTVSWDAVPGAVREQVAPTDVSPSTQAFAAQLAQAGASGSPSGVTVSVGELRTASAALVGAEPTTASLDGFEQAALKRVLADAPSALSSSARAFGEDLAALYAERPTPTLSRASSKTLTLPSSRADVRFARATVNAAAAPAGVRAMNTLTQQQLQRQAGQLVPVTKTELLKQLRAAGVSSADAKAASEALGPGTFVAGALFEQGADWLPRARGPVFFGVSENGRTVSAIAVTPPPVAPTIDARATIATMLGVDREVEVLASRTTARGAELDLAYQANTGSIRATLVVPPAGEPSITNLSLSPILDRGLSDGLAQRLQTALGAAQIVEGSVSRPAQGVGFVAAHRPAAGGALTLSNIVVAVGGESAEVTPRRISSSASDLALARRLAFVLARSHAESLVADPIAPDAARLEVALRTRTLDDGAMQQVDPNDSPVGFNTATDRVQYSLPNVWGDNAVFVTFARDGSVRVEDAN